MSTRLHCNYISVLPNVPIEGNLVSTGRIPGTEYMYKCFIEERQVLPRRAPRNGDRVAIVRYDITMSIDNSDYYRIDVFRRKNSKLKKEAEFWIENDSEFEELQRRLNMVYLFSKLF